MSQLPPQGHIRQIATLWKPLFSKPLASHKILCPTVLFHTLSTRASICFHTAMGVGNYAETYDHAPVMDQYTSCVCTGLSIVLMNYCCVDIHFRLPNIPSGLHQSPFLCPWDCEKMGVPLLLIDLFCHHPNKDLHNIITTKRYPSLFASHTCRSLLIHCYTCRYRSTCWVSTLMSTQTLHGMLSSIWWVNNNATTHTCIHNIIIKLYPVYTSTYLGWRYFDSIMSQ